MKAKTGFPRRIALASPRPGWHLINIILEVHDRPLNAVVCV
jgi:hypothetical protein